MGINNSIIEALANKLYDLFVANPVQYAKQKDDGSYNTIYQRLYPSKIKNILENKGSILTYQEAQGYLKWICLDFDIKKEYKDQFDNKKDDLKKIIDRACTILSIFKINYLLECSGNRGFHIWIIFENTIKKCYGYAIAENICNKIGDLPESIAIDCYPKTPEVNAKTKGLGLGVKLPLSFHKKSLKYSFIVELVTDTFFNKTTWPSTLNDSFLENQLKILCNYSLQDAMDIITALKIDIKKYDIEDHIPLYIRLNKIKLEEKYSLDNILKILRKCNCLKNILSNFQSNLSNQERLILVGLLSRLTIKNNDNYGIQLLQEIFSQLPNYDFDKTIEKLESVKNFFPPTCSYLKSKYSIDCSNCICKNNNSPIELLADIEIATVKWHSITETLFLNAQNATKNYTFNNDEVPLYHIEKFIENFKFSDILVKYSKILNGDYIPSNETYKFIRNEGDGKERTLFTISPEDKLLSVIALNHIHSFWNDAFYSHSYGYRLNDSYSCGYVFESWLTLWKTFIKNIKDIIEDEESAYDKYFIIKIDLKSYYDNINQQQLRIKLLDNPIECIAYKLNKLSENEKFYYQNIINYFFRICKITNPDKGVPQGPAFARYLAEIFLIGFDNLIFDNLKKGHEFYFRYVDDIFIFVESQEKKDIISKQISEYLILNNLELNVSKSIQMTVKEFKEQKRLKKYSDESKYFIDQTLKHLSIATQDDINRMSAQAHQLLQNSKWGLKDNYRFIYNHVFSDFSLNHDKELFENKIILASEARGALFTTFYDSYYFKKDLIMFLDSSIIDEMSVLSYECYLNSLLRLNLPLIKIEEIKTHIKCLLLKFNKFTTKSIMICLLQLALKYEIEIGKNILDKLDGESLNIVLSSPEVYIIRYNILSEEIFSKIFPLKLSFQDFIERIYNITYTNKFNLHGLNSLSKYFWARSSEYNEFSYNNISLVKAYNLLCIYSITITNIQEYIGSIQKNWQEFYRKLNDSGESVILDWFYCLPEDEINNLNLSTLNICMTFDQVGGLLQHCNDLKYHLLNKFREIILTIISGQKELIAKMLEEHSQIQSFINDLIKKDKFIEWIYDSDAHLFPDRLQCFSNIALNNLVVMNKHNSYLVKLLDGEIYIFDYLSHISQHNSAIVTFIKDDSYFKIDDYFKCNLILEMFSKYINLYNTSVKFMSDYSCNYPNYFYDNVYLNASLKPNMPYYAKCEYLISSKFHPLKNNEENFCNLLVNKLLEHNIEIFPGKGTSYHYNLDKNHSEYFFPVTIKSEIMKIKYISRFIDMANKYDSRCFSYHSFEYSWAETLLEVIEESNTLNKEIIFRFFECYIQHHANKKVENPELYHLIFSIEHTQVNDSNLESFFNSIISSLSIEKLKSYVNKLIMDVNGTLNKFFMEAIEGEFTYSLSNLKKTDIDVISKKNPGQSSENFEINNGTEVLFSDTSHKKLFVYEFGKHDIVQAFLKEQMVDVLTNKSLYKFCLNYDLFSLIVIVPRELQKVFESIEKRRNWLNKWDDFSNSDLKLLFNYEKNIINVCDDIDVATKLLINHYYPLQDNKLEVTKERIVNWLLLFNDKSLQGSKLLKFMNDNSLSISHLYKTILDVICLHECITKNDIEKFRSNFISLINNNTMFFSLKSLSDANGLHHLLAVSGSSFTRDADLDNCYQKVLNKSAICDQLVILCDVGITCTELKKALNFYINNEFNVKKGRARILKEQCYYDFSFEDSVERSRFKYNFTNFRKVIILGALSTEEYTNIASSTLKELFAANGNFDVTVEFRFSRTIKLFKFVDFNFPAIQSELFKNLILDKDLIKKLFNISDWEPDYYDYVRSNRWHNELHLILRLQSTPQKRFPLFTLQPITNNIKSLFDRRNEHI